GPLALDAGDLPACVVAVAGERFERAGLGQRRPRPVIQAGAAAEVGDVAEGALRARGHDGFAHGRGKAGDLAEAEADRGVGAAMAAIRTITVGAAIAAIRDFRETPIAAVAAPAGWRRGFDQGVVPVAVDGIHRQYLHARARAPAAARILHDLAGRI